MRSVAVICEYNPFHNGHACLIAEIKKAFPGYAVVSVMSGNTVQRGDFAVQGKYVRAESALRNGSDLVIELPFPFSVSAAEQFAKAGVYIAHSIKADVLAFGSESGELEKLRTAAIRLSSDAFENALKKEAGESADESFISVRERVYNALYGERLYDSGNDILATEYIRNTEKYGDIRPYAIHRTAPFSATAARKAIFTEDKAEISRLIPTDADISGIHGGLPALSTLVLGHLRLSPSRDSGNGIRNAIKQAAERAESYGELIGMLPTKTYTLARLRREMISMLLDVTDADKNELPEYTVLLGANETGLKYLSERKKEMTFPVLTKKADARGISENGRRQLQKAELCDSIYALGSEKETGAYFKTPVIIK